MERKADANWQETVDRFFGHTRLEEDTGCWIWTAAIRAGYGRFKLRGRYYSAHRFAYELLVGPIPEGMSLDHYCLNTRCVNPEHMAVVPPEANVARGNKTRHLHKREVMRQTDPNRAG